ncbi:response regulator transcription factor [Nonomuraea monospora]
MIRVLLADDQSLFRAGLAMLLEAEPDIKVIAEAGDGGEAVREARLLQPDVVVMDVRMPGVDGVEATRLITEDVSSQDPDKPIRVLILTAYNIDAAVGAAIRNGATGFLLKDAAPATLADAVRALAAGDAWLAPPVTRMLLREFAARPVLSALTPEEMRALTPREREVLSWVARGLSNAEIAGELVIGEATVKTHVARVLMKLGLRDRAQAVAAAYQSGLVECGGDA